MRKLRLAAVLLAAALASPSAIAQPTVINQTGETTETQERRAAAANWDIIWNLIGCFGLVGLLGLGRSTDNDGYTDDPI